MRLSTLAGAWSDVERDIDRILIERDRIARRVQTLAEEIEHDLDLFCDDEAEIIIVPVLTGAMVFFADLIRHLPQKLSIDVIIARSYEGATTKSSGDPIIRHLPEDLTNKHVLIVDDILDSGTTITRIREAIETRGPRSVRACVLLRKQLPSAMSTVCEYVGFDIADEFVVGYGLDYDDYYRNLPDIGVLKKEAM
ncbi:MAG: hypoxanthine phosphoribosyltransferase [Planctomycetota bacterium]|jgi:hypoxanthine phosphoribosyltransferase